MEYVSLYASSSLPDLRLLLILSQLFSATSLREATKGIELNRAVYVFTVVTVIYTPISFLAVGSLSPS